MFASYFENKKPVYNKLSAFGFVKQESGFTYSVPVVDGQFCFTVCVNSDGKVITNLTDTDSGEAYTLHLVPGAVGAFVGRIRSECQDILRQIAEQCFETDIFKSPVTRLVLQYAEQKYADRPEFLWPKFSNNAVLRRQDCQKWYAAILTVSKQKLGLAGDETVEIIDLRGKPETIVTLIDRKKYFPGYHMNKKHWFTICLDGSVPVEDIFNHLDESYLLARK